MSDNVISMNGVSLSSRVEEELANYTVYSDGTIHMKQRGLDLYGDSARRLGIDIRRIRTVRAMKNLQFRSWKLTLGDVARSPRLPEKHRGFCAGLLDASTTALA